ncbi:oxidase EvaA [Nocardiopsis sp. Huas11]|uniref:NDP-hexose 2,3-dehydratase family protein n=1 Tax=Nocardiopsis sp. Huas11 TaxID=2183912 RepID=UPI000EB5882A|nr:NDP-hexose 2,3-dehydratase family protein [Nocardiopsis sp. Huas11]RKS06876.1 oxidase EvaA [Nocardiopsis sp. Huas11]
MTAAPLGRRIALSASGDATPSSSDAELEEWWLSRPRHELLSVDRTGFDATDQWYFSADTGDLAHRSGGFFSVRGLEASDSGRTVHQPAIHQSEIGVLGILVKEIAGVPHFLMQAKFEPGNVNLRQLSPTVQATKSNYTAVHGGRSTPYMEYFRAPRPGRVLSDVLQSEQGEWFWHKHNRNIVVEVPPDTEVPARQDHRWCTLAQIHRMLHRDNVVNMDTRTVLSTLPVERADAPEGADPFTRALYRSYEDASLHSMTEVLSWFTEAKAVNEARSRLVPLGGLAGWERTDDEIRPLRHAGFHIIMVSVRARIREVDSWVQPLLAPTGPGFAAFLVKDIDGVLHVLVRSRAEPGTRDGVEMAPTVQDSPSAAALGRTEPYADEVRTRGRVLYDNLLSEEGGRFHHAQTRYRIVEATPELSTEVPEDFCWVTVAQLMELVRHGRYLNIEARTLLLCVHTLG